MEEALDLSSDRLLNNNNNNPSLLYVFPSTRHVYGEHQNVNWSCSRLHESKPADEIHSHVALQENCHQMVRKYLKCGSSDSSQCIKSVL